jgi:hypothetical protein
VPLFLQKLIYHMHEVKRDYAKEFSPGGRLSFLEKRRVPFMSVANQKWVEYLKKIPHSRFGEMERSRNQDRIDMRCIPFSSEVDVLSFSAECKDWNRSIDVNTLENTVIPNIPESSQLHLIFVRELQNQYYTAAKKKGNLTYVQAFGKHPRAKDFVFFKLEDPTEKENAARIFHEISGLPSKTNVPTCAVLFVIIPKQLTEKYVSFQE